MENTKTSSEQNTIINVDKLIKKMLDESIEIKRWILGKYSTESYFDTDLTKCIYIYNGRPICHNRFCFTKDGTRCAMCNSFSLLTNDGNLYDGCKILIEHGFLKNSTLILYKNPRVNTSEFGKYIHKNVQFDSFLLTISNLNNYERMINKSCNISHNIVMSCLLNTLEAPYKSSYIGSWVCDSVNKICYFPNLGNIYNVSFTEKQFKDIFLQIFLLSNSENFFHGSQNTDTFSFGSYETTLKITKDKSINLSLTLFVEPDLYSSFITNYNNRKLLIVGNKTIDEIQQPNWNIEYSFTQNNDIYKKSYAKISQNPSIMSYLQKRVCKIKITREIINFMRMTGINAIPSINLFLNLTVFLTNRSFYQNFISSDFLLYVKKLMLDEEFVRYMRIVQENVGKKLNCDEIVDLIITANIGIRFDANIILGNLIGKIYS